MNVLIVEDYEGIAISLKYVIDMEFGLESQVCININQCIKMLAWYKPDLVLLDWMLDYEPATLVLEKIRLISPNSVVILQTACSDADKIAREHSIKYLIKKPFSIDDFLILLKTAISKK